MFKAIGRRIYSRRREMKLTQGQLSQKAGISLSFLGHIERGSRKLSVETLVALCNALECSPNDLLCLDIPDSRSLINVLRTVMTKLEELNKRGLLDGITGE